MPSPVNILANFGEHIVDMEKIPMDANPFDPQYDKPFFDEVYVKDVKVTLDGTERSLGTNLVIRLNSEANTNPLGNQGVQWFDPYTYTSFKGVVEYVDDETVDMKYPISGTPEIRLGYPASDGIHALQPKDYPRFKFEKIKEKITETLPRGQVTKQGLDALRDSIREEFGNKIGDVYFEPFLDPTSGDMKLTIAVMPPAREVRTEFLEEVNFPEDARPLEVMDELAESFRTGCNGFTWNDYQKGVEQLRKKYADSSEYYIEEVEEPWIQTDGAAIVPIRLVSIRENTPYLIQVVNAEGEPQTYYLDSVTFPQDLYEELANPFLAFIDAEIEPTNPPFALNTLPNANNVTEDKETIRQYFEGQGKQVTFPEDDDLPPALVTSRFTIYTIQIN